MIPLVLLAGMNCSADLFTDVVGGSVPLSRTVLTPTLDRAELAAQVDALLAELPPRFALGGLSLGGIVAMAVARIAPERVAGLFLMDTNAKGPTAEQRLSWARSRSALAGGLTARQTQQDLLVVLLSPHARQRADLVERTLAMADEVGESTLDAQLALQGTRVDERTALGRLTIPVTVLCGDADALCPVGNHEEIAAAIPEAQLVVLPGRGHLVTLEDPAGVREALDAWLGRVDADADADADAAESAAPAPHPGER